MADPAPIQPLIDDTELSTLDDFLDSDRVDSEALDIFGAHGFLVALAIAPHETDAAIWVPVLFNGEPTFTDDDERDRILGSLEAIARNAVHAFEQGHLPELPFDLALEDDADDDEEPPLTSWCAGFMEGVFLNEASWFGPFEESAAQLLLPFMALSGLFAEEDPELARLAHTPREASRLAAQLPELALDLYLLYRTPPETKSARPPVKKAAKGRRGNKKR